jgi:hypothetical protein
MYCRLKHALPIAFLVGQHYLWKQAGKISAGTSQHFNLSDHCALILQCRIAILIQRDKGAVLWNIYNTMKFRQPRHWRVPSCQKQGKKQGEVLAGSLVRNAMAVKNPINSSRLVSGRVYLPYSHESI